MQILNPLNAELNPIFHLLALLGAHHIFHVSRIRVKRLRHQVNHSLPFSAEAKNEWNLTLLPHVPSWLVQGEA